MKRNTIVSTPRDLINGFAHMMAAIPRITDVERLPHPLLQTLFDSLLDDTLPDTNGASSRVVAELIERDKGEYVIGKLRALLPSRFPKLPAESLSVATSPADAREEDLLTALTLLLLGPDHTFTCEILTLLSAVAHRKLFSEWLFVWQGAACALPLPQKAKRRGHLRPRKLNKRKA